jgi:hypothetical protein
MKPVIKVKIAKDGTHEPVITPGSSMPLNALKIELHLCCDSRRDDCPYYVKIELENKYFAFAQGFCGYQFKK